MEEDTVQKQWSGMLSADKYDNDLTSLEADLRTRRILKLPWS